MGAITAAFDKKGMTAASSAFTMLKELKHRGTKAPTVAGQPLMFIAQALGELRNEKTFSKAVVGTNSSEPVLGENYTLVLEGRFFAPDDLAVTHFMKNMGTQPLKTARHILKELDGSYTFAVAFPNKILVGRDTMGTKPLYYGESESICAVASERKALWKIGIIDVHSFPPGNLAIMNRTGFSFEPVAAIKPVPQKEEKMVDAASCLQQLLEESTRERVSDVKKIGVAFSGGLDSSVVAFLAKLSGASVHLICVGLEGQREIEHADEAAEALGLPLKLQKYTVEDVETALSEVLWLIEEPDAVKTGVAIPLFWTAEAASKLRCRVLLAGQGADELFGGYRRYLTEYATGGVERVQKALFHDTAMSHETNFQRDEPVCAFHKVELRLPFTDTEVVRFALSLPLNLKIESAEDNLRKRVLRQVAKNLGVAAFIADKPKKAVQFATGVNKALEKLAKREGLTQRSYVDKVFRKVYPSLEVKNA